MTFIIAFTALECVKRYIARKPYAESLNIWSDLPPTLPYGSNWDHKIADFLFLPYISFIIAFTDYVKRDLPKPYVESLYSWSHLYPLTPLMGYTVVIKYCLTFTFSISAAGFSFQKTFSTISLYCI